MAKEELVTAKGFREYTPADSDKMYVHIQDSEGRDWYDLRVSFKEDTLKVAYNDNGIILASGKIFNNPEVPDSFWPVNLNVAEVEKYPRDYSFKPMAWVYDEKTATVKKRVLTKDEKQVEVDKEIKRKIDEVMSSISPLSIAQQLGDITEKESQELKNLQKYVVLLNRVKLQEGYPEKIEWPELVKT